MNKKVLLIFSIMILCNAVFAYNYEKTIDVNDLPYNETVLFLLNVANDNTLIDITSSSNWLLVEDTINASTSGAYNLSVGILIPNGSASGEYEEELELNTNYNNSATFTFFFNLTGEYINQTDNNLSNETTGNLTTLRFKIKNHYTNDELKDVIVNISYDNSTLAKKTDNNGEVEFKDLPRDINVTYLLTKSNYFPKKNDILLNKATISLDLGLIPEDFNFTDLPKDKQIEIAQNLLGTLLTNETNETKIEYITKTEYITKLIPFSSGFWSQLLKCDTVYIKTCEDGWEQCQSIAATTQTQNDRLSYQNTQLTEQLAEAKKGKISTWWIILPIILYLITGGLILTKRHFAGGYFGRL